MPNYNSMQANLGLIPGAGPQVQVKSPAQAAAELSQQASMQLQAAQSMLPVTRSSSAAFTFGQQYAQQYQAAQAQSSYGPYAANMLGSFTQPGALPSPMMMTPAHTGVYRPPMPYGSGAGGTPMSPMPVMPMFQTPLTPQLPVPSFRTPWEQEIQQRELRADQVYSMAAQTPRFLGQGAGYGMGAMAGAAAGGRFGAVGAGVGAVLGGILSHYSGFGQGMGAMGMAPMRPGIEAHSMGLSAQRMSQDWVVGGPDRHPLGRGLSRDASMALGQGIQSMASSQSFKAETGGMFNRHDLMQIMQGSGKAGLMDFDQGVDKIQEQLRNVSRTVKRFMELTNDPDVNSVIRRMGQMHTLGLSVPEIEGAASSMRAFSRAAGTTVGGIWQQGLPGAMTYQSMGLSGGAGLQYGMYSAAAARQAVASGTFSHSQLAMFGGVQGVAQRNMQAQAAFMSMPMFGASVAQYGAGGWGMDPISLARMGSSGASPQGMVMGAVSNMNAAVQQGGIGALAMMPLQQKQIADQAARTMSPYEQTAARFTMAQNTGKFLGLSGAGAFAAGARMLYGDDVASQMLVEASNPEYWRAQRRMIHEERDTLARQQRQDIMDAAPGIFARMGRVAEGAIGRGVSAVTDPARGVGEAAGRGWRNWVSRPLQEQRDRASGSITWDSLDPGMSADTSTKEGRSAYAARRRRLSASRGGGGGLHMTGRDAYDAFLGDVINAGDDRTADYWGGALDTAVTGIGGAIPGLGLGMMGASFAGVNIGESMRGGIGAAYLAYAESNPEAKARLTARQDAQLWSAARIEGSAGRTLLGGHTSGAFTSLEKTLGLGAGQGAWAIYAAGKEMAAAAGDVAGVFDFTSDNLTSATLKQAMVRGIAAQTGKSEAEVSKSVTGDVFDELFEASFASGKKGASDTERAQFQRFEEREAGGVKRRGLAASRAEMEAIRSRREERANMLGIERGARGEVGSLMGQYSPAELVALTLNQGENLDASQQNAWLERLKQQVAADEGIKDPAKITERALAIMDRMQGVTISDEARRGLGRFTKHKSGFESLMSEMDDVTSAQYAERTRGALSKVGTAIGKAGIDEAGIMALSKDQRKALRDKGLGRIADIADKAESATGDQQAALLDSLRSELETLGSSGGSESLVTPTGDKARDLTRADKKLSEVAREMSVAFEPFAAATTTFSQAAAIFHEAATIDKRNREGPQ